MNVKTHTDLHQNSTRFGPLSYIEREREGREREKQKDEKTEVVST
jgi:hypothetical protein